MNNTRFFVVFALILALVAVGAQIIQAFITPIKDSSGLSASTISLLPTGFNEEIITKIETRASKYLIITKDQFENGQTAAIPTATPTPSGGP